MIYNRHIFRLRHSPAWPAWRSNIKLFFYFQIAVRCQATGITLRSSNVEEGGSLQNVIKIVSVEDSALLWWDQSWNMFDNNWWVSIFLLFLIKPLPSQFMVNYEWDKRQQTMAPTSDHLRPPAADNKIFCFASHLTPFYNYYHQSNNLTDCSHSDKDFFSLTQLTTFSLSVRNY